MAQTPVVIEQRIDAGSQFDRQNPSTVAADDQAIRVFPSDTQGGRFVFDFTGPDASFVTYVVEQIFIDFGDAATAVVEIEDSVTPTPNRAEIAAPGAGVYLNTDPIYLGWDQRIVLNTTGATVALFARVMARPVLGKG